MPIKKRSTCSAADFGALLQAEIMVAINTHNPISEQISVNILIRLPILPICGIASRNFDKIPVKTPNTKASNA